MFILLECCVVIIILHIVFVLGLAGFARLIPGDVYQVSVTHGQQKWKTKGRVGTNSQHWDNDTFLFKALVGDVFAIKVEYNIP